MQITLNGQPRELEDGATVAALLAACDLQPVRVAVEVNEQIVRRSAFATTQLRPGDRVEVVTFVGGG